MCAISIAVESPPLGRAPSPRPGADVPAEPLALPAGAPVPTFLAGTANRALAASIVRELGVPLGACDVERFPDGEVSVRLGEPVRGREVVLLQPTAPPVNDHVMELLALADACRRAAAARIVAVVPYFGYARSDRRDGELTPITGSLVARMMEAAGVDQLLTVDVHTRALEGFFRVPADNLTAAPVLAAALRARLAPDAVVASPDLGAVKLATRYATLLERPVAVCHKQRRGPREVAVARVTGDVAGRPCVLVDDMISTGRTMAEAIRALRAAGATGDVTVAATHGVLSPGALETLAEAGVRALLVTDTIAYVPPRWGPETELAVDVVSVGPLLATAIRRILTGGSLRDLA